MRGKGEGTLGLMLALVALAFPASAAAQVNSAALWQDGKRQSPWTAPADATYAIEGDARSVTLYVGEADYEFTMFQFAAPPPELLKPGVYDRAMRATPERGRPGIYVSHSPWTCNTFDGRFEVKDFALGADGVPTRLWVLFEYLCDGYRPLSGEVRYAAPHPGGTVLAVPSVLRWPAFDFGTVREPASITFRAQAPTQLGQARITGADAPEFSIGSDTCSGRSLGAGESCAVTARFAPSGPGTRIAALDLGAAEVPLQGFSYGGVTRLEYTDGSGLHVVTPADGWFELYGGANRARFYSGAPWTGGNGTFIAPSEDPLLPGRYTGSQGNTHEAMPKPYPRSSTDVGDCSGSGGGFTIRDYSRHPDGAARTLAVDFVQPCSPNDPVPELRGSFSYRVGDTTPPAPWMVAGARQPAAGLDPSATSPARASWRCAARSTPRTGTRRANRLRGTSRADRLDGRGGDDRLRGGRGADCLTGGAGRDRLHGGTGRDLLRGGPGADVLIGGPGRDRLDCGAGRDIAYAGRGDRTRGCERIRR